MGAACFQRTATREHQEAPVRSAPAPGDPHAIVIQRHRLAAKPRHQAAGSDPWFAPGLRTPPRHAQRAAACEYRGAGGGCGSAAPPNSTRRRPCAGTSGTARTGRHGRASVGAGMPDPDAGGSRAAMPVAWAWAWRLRSSHEGPAAKPDTRGIHRYPFLSMGSRK